MAYGDACFYAAGVNFPLFLQKSPPGRQWVISFVNMPAQQTDPMAMCFSSQWLSI
jgi:hypothetical protein